MIARIENRRETKTKSQTWKPEEWEAWLNGRVGRKGDKTYRVRILVQAGFALTCLILGFQLPVS